ncbi:P-loop NTPase fold protein [Campylobacter sp. LH-2024]|uniref:P-loop NTPase fold protein n=2 Tax=Campylobacter sp. LH-2024 TaxID=3239825 RepID=UPI003AA9928E
MNCKNKEELSYKEQIKIFLEDKNKYSLFIKGKWGVGKTYLWKEIEYEISNTKKDFELNKIKLNFFSHLKYLYEFIILIVKFLIKYFSYCEFIKQDKSLRVVYISLFGKEHYREILEEITLNSYKYNKLVYFLRNLTFWKISIGSLFQFFIKQDFKNIIVCFDDLERKSDKLNIKDLLGLINNLKEGKCKVILIGDDSKLNNKEIFDNYKEKCIDLEITIDSRLEVVLQIVKEKCPQINTKLLPCALLNGIKNLRQLNKILSAFNYFHEELHFKEKLVENPDCKDFLVYVFEVIVEKIDNVCTISSELLEFKHLFIKIIEEIIKDYFNNATYLISNRMREVFNSELDNYQLYIYRTNFIQILSNLIQTNVFNENDKEKINEILQYIADKNKIDDFIDLSKIGIVDFFALTYIFDLHNNQVVMEIKKKYIRKFYGNFSHIGLLLKMEQNKNDDLLEEFNKMVEHFDNHSNEYFQNEYKTPTQEIMDGVKNYYNFYNVAKSINATKDKTLYKNLKNNKITSYYLDYLFLNKTNREKFSNLYDEYKNDNKSSIKVNC